MDNTSYHSETIKKFPNMNWKKRGLLVYLVGKGVVWSSSEIKAELLKKAKSFQALAKKYRVDGIGASAGSLSRGCPLINVN